jgi:hypothetical protein
MNEIVGNLMRQREIPREMTSTGKERNGEYIPGNQGLAEFASFDIAVVCQA